MNFFFKVTIGAFALLITLGGLVKGQDVQFSQFYAAQTYLNPGYAGSVHAPRGILHQRVQWPSLNAKYYTFLASADFFSEQYHSGFGIMFLHDYMGSDNITSTEVHLQYAYELPISDKITVRPGLQLGLASRNLNYADLSFPHQFTNAGKVFDSQYSSFGKETKFYADVGAGAVVYTDKFWFSISGNHLNMPNQSITGEIARLPVKFATAAGYKILLNKNKQMAYLNTKEEVSITPVFHYKFQGKSDQVDVGTYVRYNELLTGVWYRGIPFKTYEAGLHNNESLVFIVGWIYGNISVSYSYDYTLSRLRPAKTRGAHELNLTYILRPGKKSKPKKRLPCPTFYNDHL